MLFLGRSPRLWVSLAVSGGTVLWLNLSIMDKEGWSHGCTLCPTKGLLWPSLGENERQKDGEAFILCLPQKSNSQPHQVHRASIAAPAVAVRDRQSGVKNTVRRRPRQAETTRLWGKAFISSDGCKKLVMPKGG